MNADQHDDRGMTLVETLVAMMILLMLAAAALLGLQAAYGAGGGNRDRAVAGDIAQQELSRLRATPVSTLAELASADPEARVSVVDGRQYTVTPSVVALRNSMDSPGCTGATGKGFLKIAATVTWTNNQGAAPVTLQQLVSLGSLQSDDATGNGLVVISNAQGEPIQDVTVRLSGPSGAMAQTDSGGCATFSGLPSGSYAVDAYDSASSLVGVGGGTHEHATLAIAAQQTTTVTVLLDVPARVSVSIITVNKNGAAVASQAPAVRLAQAGLPGGERVLTSDAAMDAAKFFPFTAPYSIHTGSCLKQAAPSGWVIPAAARTRGATAQVQASPGESSDVVLYQPAVVTQVLLKKVPAEDALVVLTPADCGGSISRRTDVSGRMADQGVPYGSWNLCAAVTDSKTGIVRALQTTAPFLTQNGGPPTVDVDVVSAGFKRVTSCA